MKNNDNSNIETIKDLNVDIKYENKDEFIDEIIEINQLRKQDSNRGIWEYEDKQQNYNKWSRIISIALGALTKGYNLVIICRLIEALISVNTTEGIWKSLQIINKSPERVQLEQWCNKNLLTCIYRNPRFYPISKKTVVMLEYKEFERFQQILLFTKNNVSSLLDKIEHIIKFLKVKPYEEENTIPNTTESIENYPDAETVQTNNGSINLEKMTTNEKYEEIEKIVDSILTNQKQDLIANMMKNLMKLKSRAILDIINIKDWKTILFGQE